MLLASFPSPESGVIHVGPVSLHLYGLCIALGVMAGVWLSNRRWPLRGGTVEDVTTLALWGVPAGIIGARIYHVITDYQLYQDNPLKALAIWDGGLGIWGGIAAGVGAGLVVGHIRGLSKLSLLDMAAPALPLAQGIGRFGNYFNQELFGKPTDLPWAVQIDAAYRPDGYEAFSTFHPTFLYEALWCFALCSTLMYLDGKRRLRPGQLFLTYVAGYTFMRFFIERLRIDVAHEILGLRVNEWTSLIVFTTACLLLFLNHRRGDTASGEGASSSVDQDRVETS